MYVNRIKKRVDLHLTHIYYFRITWYKRETKFLSTIKRFFVWNEGGSVRQTEKARLPRQERYVESKCLERLFYQYMSFFLIQQKKVTVTVKEINRFP